MKRFSEQFKKKSESIRLRSAQRADLRDRIVAYMEYHPLPKEARAPRKSAHTEHIVSEPFRTVAVRFTYVRNIVGALMIVLLVSIPVFAERSVPGDILYPVKVQFNEELLSSLSFSPYAKVEWETERLERRIAEARLLAREGKLTEAVEARVSEAVLAHRDAVQQEINHLRESDSDEAAIAEISLASALAVQTEVLEGHMQQDVASGMVEGEGNFVQELALLLAQARDDMEASQGSPYPSFEKLLARIEMETTNVHELFASIQESASPEEVADIERRLEDIQRKVAEALALHDGVSVVSEGETNETDGPSTSTDSAEVSMALMQSPSSTVATNNTATSTDATSTEDSAQGESVDLSESTDPNPNHEALALLRASLSDTQKLISFLTNIDVRENVTIDELVPVTLTKEERAQNVSILLNEVIALEEEIATIPVGQSITDKANPAKEQLSRTVDLTTDALNKGNIAAAESHVEFAYKLAQELRLFLENQLHTSESSGGGVDPDEGTEDSEDATTTSSVRGTSTPQEEN